MKQQDNQGNVVLRRAVKSLAKREQCSWTEAITRIAKQAGYSNPVKIYEFLNNVRRPSGDNRVRIARIVKRRVEELWPVEEDAI